MQRAALALFPERLLNRSGSTARYTNKDTTSNIHPHKVKDALYINIQLT